MGGAAVAERPRGDLEHQVADREVAFEALEGILAVQGGKNLGGGDRSGQQRTRLATTDDPAALSQALCGRDRQHRRGHAVPAHVEDVEAQRPVVEDEGTEEVSAHGVAGSEMPREGDPGERKALLGQERPLDVRGRPQVLLERLCLS
jgi:hypothetical protein